MNSITIILILLSHWVSDFILQSNWMSTNKSKSFPVLIAHTLTYSVAMCVMITILTEFNMLIDKYVYSYILFLLIMFITHTIIDFITSKINSKLWDKNEVHWFFTSIGFDQWLHYLTIFITINYLYI